MKNREQTLWIVSELFYPEETSTSYILTQIANKLSTKYQVKIICGSMVYEKEKLSQTFLSLDDSVVVNRLSGLKWNKNNLILRLLRFILLSFKMTFFLWKEVRREDKVLIVTNPVPLLLFITGLKKNKSFELNILVHDVFPENTIPAGLFSSNKNLLYRILKFVFDKAYSRADTLIVLGRDMQEVILSKIKRFKSKVRIENIENWGEIDKITVIPRESSGIIELGLQDKIVFQYAGNLGRVQGLKELLYIIKKVNNPLLHFVFLGDGALKAEMKRIVQEDRIENVTIGNGYRRDEQCKVLNSCDIAIVTLSCGMYGLGVPSKSYNIMAAGKPILFIGEANSELGLTITENEIGYNFALSQQGKLIAFLNSIDKNKLSEFREKGIKARNLVELKYAENVILNRYLSVI